MDLKGFVTESRNPNTLHIDQASTLDIVRMINDEDKKVAYAVEKELGHIAKAIDLGFDKIKKGGRLIYCGAGTSGRLGILDASECPPTYGVSYDTVQGIIAGGPHAIVNAVEGAEDDAEQCIEDLKALKFSRDDMLVGIAASGRTPYVIGGLRYAQQLGAPTATISCNPDAVMNQYADAAIAPVVGPEAITGSTRMKSGTAQKMILNMISTGIMIKWGKVYSNLMVDVKATNEKLIHRAAGIVAQITQLSKEDAMVRLEATDYNVKLTIMMVLSGLDMDAAKECLEHNDGHLAKALESVK